MDQSKKQKKMTLRARLDQREREILTEALSNATVIEACNKLGMTRQNLWRLMKKHNLRREIRVPAQDALPLGLKLPEKNSGGRSTCKR